VDDAKPHSDLTIKIVGDEIERIDQICYLGIELNEHLCYKHHVARTITKCMQQLGALCRTIKKWVLKSIFENFYKTTVLPVLAYAIESWYPSQIQLQKTVEKWQKFAARLVTNN
jgi:hypothetical protein